jgi:putative ABC transport system permease protein
MLLQETVKSAVRSLVSHRLRTALTSLGMIIGVAAVISTLAIGEGAQASVEGRIRSLGSNLLMVSPGSASNGRVRGGSVTTLTADDAESLADLEGVVAVAPESSASAQLKFRGNNANKQVVGTTPDYLEVRSLEVAQGIGLSEEDVSTRRRVAILGHAVAAELFDGGSPLGERVQIDGTSFTVVGILAEKGPGWGSPDDQVIVPLSTHQKTLFGRDYVSSISVQVADEGASALAQLQIEELLRLRHAIRVGAEDDFQVRSQTEMLDTMSEVTGTFTALLGSVAAVSLLVGGIGIMNIMLVSVQERTREIGVRIAVGARRRDVLLQFLVEAVIVSLFGGVAGLCFGYLGAMGIARFGGWDTVVPTYAVALALTTSVVIGLVFGVGPARRASRLDPVEALRQE